MRRCASSTSSATTSIAWSSSPQDEAELLGEVRKEYDRFTVTVTRVVDVIRAGRTAEARDMQLAEIVPLADRLERLTNQLVNIAEADMVAAIDATEPDLPDLADHRHRLRAGQPPARPWPRLCHLLVAGRTGQGNRGAAAPDRGRRIRATGRCREPRRTWRTRRQRQPDF